MEELFQRTGASGETVRRCISFFLAAARSAGIPFSSYLRPHKGKQARSTSAKSEPPDNPPGSATPETSKKIYLGSGGTLTLQLSLDVFKLDKGDRQFVFDLIDQLNKYPQGSSRPKQDESDSVAQ